MDIIWIAALIYFAPALIALIRGHLSSGAIVVLNIALGWTLLGWFIALLWSLTGNTRGNRMARPLALQTEPPPVYESPYRLVAMSTGETLDALAREYGIMPTRQFGEPDQDFRRRIMRVVNPRFYA